MFARTERLLLRPSWPEDAGELHQAIADDGIVRNLARAPWPFTTKDAVRFATQQHDAHFPSFLLMLRTNGAPRLIGECGIGNFNNDAELGYWIGRPYWGLGFATEAGRAVIEIAKAIGHRKLHASHFTDNPASGKVLRKLGFQSTGKTALRHSNGRGIATTCALYERSLEDAVTDDGDMRSTRPLGMREYMERLQAA